MTDRADGHPVRGTGEVSSSPLDASPVAQRQLTTKPIFPHVRYDRKEVKTA